MSHQPKFIVLDENDEEMSLPCHFVVCDRCNGTGVHDNQAFSNGISSEDFNEDPDFREQYMRGDYDVPCTECDGNRVVSAPDRERLNAEQLTALESHYRGLAEAAAERRMRERGIEF